MQSIWFWGTSYIIPNMETIVCGGTAQVDDWNLTESSEDTKKIMGDICALFPSLVEAPLVRYQSFLFRVNFFFVIFNFISLRCSFSLSLQY